jgi:hypothetical protein
MNLKELIAKLPESDRAEAERVVQEAIVAGNPLAGIDSNEKAAAFIETNKFFKGAFDAGISKSNEAHDAKFVKEKLPGLVDAKIRELNPPTDPRDIKIAEFEAKLAERERKELLSNQRTIALKIAATEGIPVDDIERFIADNDDATTAQVKAYAARVKAFADAKVEAALKERLGNNGSPKGGNTIPPADLKTQYEAAAKANNGMEMLRLKGLMQAAAIQE